MKKVLVVEDEPSILRLVIELAEQADFTVFGVRETSSALELISAQRPEIVISDYSVPFIGGPELVRQARAIIPAAHFVGMSSQDDDAEGEFRAAGVNFFVLKRGPVFMTDMQAVLEYFQTAKPDN